MGFLSCTRRDTNQVCIRDLKIEYGARPLTRRGEEDGFHLETESSEPLDEKTKLYAVDPLYSRGLINSFAKAAVNYMRTNPDRFIEHMLLTNHR